MALKNRKPEYIKKLLAIEAPNGYKFDLANGLYNPAFGYEYPRFNKIISEDDEKQTIQAIYYMKHYNGTGEYCRETWTRKKTEAGSWYICENVKTEKLEPSNRFSLEKLLSFCA